MLDTFQMLVPKGRLLWRLCDGHMVAVCMIVAVYSGGLLEANNSHCTGAAVLGIEVRDLDSSAALSNCSVHDTGAPLEYPDSRFTYGMVVQAGATASLTECSVDGGGRGLVVAVGLMRETPPLGTVPNAGQLPSGSPTALGQAHQGPHTESTPRTHSRVMPLYSSVTATRCSFKYTVDCCVYCEDSAVLQLLECDIEGSRMMHGLWVSNKGVATAQSSMFVGNAQDGVFVCAGGQLTATQCDTEGNRSCGYKVTFGGGKLTAVGCSSTGEPVACEVSKPGSTLIVENMTVNDCRGCAFDVSEGATAELRGCVVNGSTFSCVTIRAPAEVKLNQCVLEGGYKGHGMLVEGNGAVVEASECKFVKNGISGVAVGNEAQVKLMHCATESNRAAGYQAAFKGQLSLFDCTCEGDTGWVCHHGGGHQAHGGERRCAG
ncbi:MAG: right-handed parallel beta-helix repeat-containing protein [Akkermansiaceae bacterium]|nr:right-handed parallel beta-helix repeat-containing protein [Akkermansiaceae bacterium]